MTRVLKRPAGAAGSLKLPVRSARGATTPAPPPAAFTPPAPMPAVQQPAQGPAADDVAALKAELEALRERAYREGLAQGRRAAEQEMRALAEAHAERWRKALEQIDVQVGERLEALEAAAVAIAYEAAGRVLGEAHAERAAVVHVVRRLLEESEGTLALTVHVAPTEVEVLKAALERDPQWQRRRLRFEADGSLAAGACRVESERGLLQTDLALQLQRIQDALLQAYSGRRSAE